MARVLAAGMSSVVVDRRVGDLAMKVKFTKLASIHLILKVLVLFLKVDIGLFKFVLLGFKLQTFCKDVVEGKEELVSGEILCCSWVCISSNKCSSVCGEGNRLLGVVSSKPGREGCKACCLEERDKSLSPLPVLRGVVASVLVGSVVVGSIVVGSIVVGSVVVGLGVLVLKCLVNLGGLWWVLGWSWFPGVEVSCSF
jgi:hypothetical protein